jgi:hypothetical protein
MQNSLFRLILLLVVFSFSYAMCSKEDAPANNNTAPVNVLNKGFLSTMGLNSINVLDTICLRNGSSGAYANITDYSHTAEAGGFIKRPRDLYELTNTGSNQYHIKISGGKYLGYKFNQYSTDYNRYSFTMDLSPAAHNLFLINWKGNKFSIRPVENPKVYLNTMAANVQPPDPSHRILRFLEGEQLWWFQP